MYKYIYLYIASRDSHAGGIKVYQKHLIKTHHKGQYADGIALMIIQKLTSHRINVNLLG